MRDQPQVTARAMGDASDDDMPPLEPNTLPEPAVGGADSDDDSDDEPAPDAPTRSLFSSKVFPSSREALEDMRTTHSFDMGKLCRSWSLGFYQRIMLINFIRQRAEGLDGGHAEVPADGSLVLHAADGSTVATLRKGDTAWQHEDLMKPVELDDGLLIDLVDDEDDEDDGEVADDAVVRSHARRARGVAPCDTDSPWPAALIGGDGGGSVVQAADERRSLPAAGGVAEAVGDFGGRCRRR